MPDHQIGVYVLPSRTIPGFAGHATEQPSVLLPHAPLQTALHTVYPCDAHIAPYAVLNGNGPLSEIPRLRKTALHWMHSRDLSVVMSHAFIDVDRKPHTPWENVTQINEAIAEVRARLPEAATCGWYATESGYRLVWRLARPIAVEHWKSWATQFLHYLRKCGIEADPITRVWTTTYRAPRIQKNPRAAILDLPRDLSSIGELAWMPESLEVELGSGITDDVEYPDSPPAVDLPSAADFGPLEGSEFHDRLSSGRPLGAPGNRRNSILRCAGQIAAILETDDPVRVYRLMLASIVGDTSGTGEGGKPDPPPTKEEAWQLCCYVARRQHAKMGQAASERAALLSHLHVHQANPGEAPEDLSGRLILMHATSVYILNETSGEYAGPYIERELEVAIRDNCPSLIPVRAENGKMLDRRHILHIHGKVVGGVFLELGRTKNWYNRCTNTLYIGICRVRGDLYAQYDGHVDHWLRTLGGPDAERLLDWLATVTDLRRPTCALYLEGHPGSGKGMLAEGVARLWATTASRYEDFIGAFNDSMERCPVLWADERIPSSRYGNTPSATIRTLIGNTSFVLRKKFLPTVQVTGCLRLIVSANNSDALGIRETLTPDDYSAIVERIGHITCTEAARLYLESIGGRRKTEEWISGDALPRHLLWLRENRKVAHGRRFLVDGWETELHRHISTRAGCTEEVLEAVAYTVSRASSVDGLFVGNDHICVSVGSLQSMMPAALGATYILPRRNALAIALRALADNSRPQVRVRTKNGATVRAWNLRVPDIAAFADGAGICDASHIMSRAQTVAPDLAIYDWTK